MTVLHLVRVRPPRRTPERKPVGHACARVSLRAPRLSVCTMVHLARQTAEGFELRSRYWIGHEPRLGVLGRSLPVDP